MKLKRQIIFTLGFMLMIFPSLAQEENIHKTKIIPKEKSEEVNLIKIYKESIESISNISIGGNLQRYNIIFPKYEPINLLQNRYDMNNITTYIKNTFHLDYNRGRSLYFSKKQFVYLEKESKNYQSLSSYISAYGALGWKINDNLSIKGGILAIKQFSGTSPSATDRSGVKFILDYKLNENANFNLWGQYLTKDNSNNSKSSNLTLMPQTGVGASATIKIGEKSKIGVATQYQEVNQFNKGNYQTKGKLQLNF